MSQFTVYSMSFKSDGMWIVSTNFTMEGFNVTNLSKDASAATARFIRIEESSIGTIHNWRFENLGFSFMSITNSQVQLLDWYLSNITSRRNTIEFLTSTGIVFRNVTTYNLYSTLFLRKYIRGIRGISRIYFRFFNKNFPENISGVSGVKVSKSLKENYEGLYFFHFTKNKIS